MPLTRITFLSLAEAIAIHNDQIERYGGQPGIRDLGLLQSALAMPRASAEGEWLHADIYEMAAAYVFHICQDHPFVDGNKRAALACGLVFLELNGVSVLDPTGRLYHAMQSVAAGRLSKNALARVFRHLPRE